MRFMKIDLGLMRLRFFSDMVAISVLDGLAVCWDFCYPLPVRLNVAGQLTAERWRARANRDQGLKAKYAAAIGRLFFLNPCSK